MQTQYASPKLLLEFYKGQKVPPLVKKYDFQTNAEQSIIRSRRNHSGHSVTSVNTQVVNSSKLNVNQLVQIQQQLDSQLNENRELRMIIKELQENLERLTSVNGELTTRVEELQKKINVLTDKSDATRRQIVRKTRVEIYKEVEDYLKISSEKFIQCLRNTKAKMNPILENKIEQYLEEVLNINSLSVRKALNEINNTRERKSFDEQEVDKTIKQIVEKRSRQKSNSKQRSRESDVNQYQVIFDKLNRQNEQFKQNLKNDSLRESPNWKTDSKPRRPKIFRKNYENNSRSISREHQKKLDF